MSFRRLIPLLLALALGLSTMGFGVARGQMPAVGQMVICTGHGIITITIDADGNPVESRTLCPDAVVTLLAAVSADAPAVPVLDAVNGARVWPVAAPADIPRPLRGRWARGPPV